MSFGNSTVHFNLEKVAELVEQGKIEEVKEYVLKYYAFCNNPAGIAEWNPTNKQVILKDIQKMKLTVFRKGIENKKKGFNLRDWFFEEHLKIYTLASDISKSRNYEINGEHFINIFPGFKYQTTPPEGWNNNPKMKGVKMIWKHCLEVLCSNSKEEFDYLQILLAEMLLGLKPGKAIFFFGEEGAGKSILTKLFLKILGSLSHVTSNPDTVRDGSFNSELAGKVLLVLEELSCASTGEWRKISDHIKHFITGDDIVINEKHKAQYRATNACSVIINSNHQAIQVNDRTRRYFIPTVSYSRVGDVKYFTTLHSYVDDPEVQMLFWYDCCRIVAENPNWNADPMPMTETRKAMMSDSLPSVQRFLKEKFVLKSKDVDLSFADFYAKYCIFCKENSMNVMGKNAVSSAVKPMGFTIAGKTGGKRFIELSFEKLHAWFKERHLMNDLDDMEDEEEKEESNSKIEKQLRELESGIDSSEDDSNSIYDVSYDESNEIMPPKPIVRIADFATPEEDLFSDEPEPESDYYIDKMGQVKLKSTLMKIKNDCKVEGESEPIKSKQSTKIKHSKADVKKIMEFFD